MLYLLEARAAVGNGDVASDLPLENLFKVFNLCNGRLVPKVNR